MIKFEDGKYTYFDKNGKEITEGCYVKYPMGKVVRVYQTEDGQLGTDATNPYWIEKGKAYPCEFGIYPFGKSETEEIEVTNWKAVEI